MVRPLLVLQHEGHDLVGKTHFDNLHGKPQQLSSGEGGSPVLGGKALSSTSNLTGEETEICFYILC